MKNRKRLVAALLVAALMLTLAPFALATDGSPAQVTKGSAKRLEIYRAKGGFWGGTDTSWLYNEFTSAASANEKVAKIYEHGGKYYIAGMTVGSTTYSATTIDGETLTGSIVVVGQWQSESGGKGGSGGGGVSVYTPPITMSTYIVKTSGTATISGINGVSNFNAGDYTWATTLAGSSISAASATTATYTAGPTAGTDVITATNKASGKAYTGAVTVAEPNAFALTQTAITVNVGGAQTVAANYIFADATKTGTWASANSSIATVDSSGKITGVAVGSTTITYKDTTSTKTATVAVTVSTYTASYSLNVSYNYDRTNAWVEVVYPSGMPSSAQDVTLNVSSGNLSLSSDGSNRWRVSRNSYYGGSYGYSYSGTINAYSSTMGSQSISVSLY